MQDFDMLVRLYDLPPVRLPDERLARAGIRVFRPLPCNLRRIMAFIEERFGPSWADEFAHAMHGEPVSCFIAVNAEGELLGFSCYDATCRGFFGPIGVDEKHRGEHIGRELLLSALYAMREAGYAYAVIGWVSEKNLPFYADACGAVPIPDSFPGVYSRMLRDR